MSVATEAVICPDCGSPMVLKTTTKFRDRAGHDRKFFGCSRFPDCTRTWSATPDGLPHGIPAMDEETRQARNAAHEVFDRLWKPPTGRMTRPQAYLHMRTLMGMSRDQAHIGNFDAEQCRELIRRLTDDRSQKRHPKRKPATFGHWTPNPKRKAHR
jgi:ssDNA-binding Zn-finger/Zn-ribbon topoisomerase 1